MIHFQSTTLFAAALLLLGPLGAQRDPEQIERLRRDQDEILRKAERLQVLMDRLRQRYEREGRKEQVQLLQQGLAHLEQTGVLREVASIRDDLAATAFTEALRKQREVVDDLERLLNILLERKAIENIEEEAKAAAEQARTARELENRQRQLIEEREAATRREPTPGEKELLSALQQLRDAERNEAEANARDAGSRRPFLESALERVRALQRQQERLDEALAAERSGRADASRAREFDLGELTQATRELQRDLRRQGRQEDLGTAARELQQQATGSDQAGRQRARDALQGKLEDAPPKREGLAGSERDPDWQRLRDQLAKVPSDDSAAPQLAAISAAAAQLAEQRTDAQKAENAAASKQLAQKAEQLAQTLAEGEAKAAPPGKDAPGSKDAPSGKVGEAAKALAAAQAATERGDRDAAQEQVNSALRALDEARAEFRQQNPDAAQRAGQMAAEAASVAQELRSAPTPEQAEQQAAAATAAASAALRQAEAAIEQGSTRSTRAPSSRAPSTTGQSPPTPAGQNPPQAGEPSDGRQNQGQPDAGQPNAGQPNAGQPTSGQPNAGQPNAGQPQANPQQPAAAPTDAKDPAAASATAKAQLAAAEKILAEALASANAGGESQQQAAAERQQQLAEQAAAAAQQLAQAAQQGQITPQQQQATQQQLAKAQQQMQQAMQQLQQGQQASASRSQQEAAQTLQQAMDAMQKERPLDAEQEQKLKDQAKAQQQLAEDIVRLAEELKKRGNKAAEQAAQQAADAARKAQRALSESDEDEAGEQQEQARQQLEKAAEELDEEQDRYQDMRQEELQFRMREELKAFLDAQRPISQQTAELQKTMPPEGLSRAARRKCNQLGEEEQQLGNKLEPLLKALSDEDSRVYLTVLQANLEDLREVSRRLSGRAPDLGRFTTLLQTDLEQRTVDLLAALESEKKRRDEERQRQQQQQQDGKNKFNPQQRKLVSLIAELEMLKRLGQDTARATSDLQALVETRDDSNLSATEAQMIERLSHRHDGITKLFQQIKAGVEKMLQQPEDEEATGPGGGR